MTAKNAAQLQFRVRHALSGNCSCAPMTERNRFLRNTSWPISRAPPMSQYSTVGFHLMKVSLWASKVAPPNSTITPRLTHCMGSTLPWRTRR